MRIEVRHIALTFLSISLAYLFVLGLYNIFYLDMLNQKPPPQALDATACLVFMLGSAALIIWGVVSLRHCWNYGVEVKVPKFKRKE